MPDEKTSDDTLRATELPDTGATAADVPAPARTRLRCHRSFAETRMGIYCMTEQCILWDKGYRSCLDRLNLQAQTDYYTLQILRITEAGERLPPDRVYLVEKPGPAEGGDEPDGEREGE